MSMTRIVSFTALAAAAALTFGALGVQAEPAPQEGKSQITDLRLGEYWFGPDITHDDLVGKVVLVEIWGS